MTDCPHMCRYCMESPRIQANEFNTRPWTVECPNCGTATLGFSELDDAVRTWNAFMEGELEIDGMADCPPVALVLIARLKVLLYRDDAMTDDIYTTINGIESLLGIDRDAVIGHMDIIDAELDEMTEEVSE